MMDKKSQARILTYAGMIPFLVCAALSLYADRIAGIEPAFALIAYGAVIVSFIAGIHWGVYLFKDAPLNLFLHSNVAALLAWLAVLVAAPHGILILALCLAYLMVIDKNLQRGHVLEAWFVRLRLRATLIVTAALLLSYFQLLLVGD